MDKRIIAVFTAFCLMIGCLCLRLYVVCSNGTEYVSSASHYYSIPIGNIRGKITDRNGENLVDEEFCNVAVAKPTVNALNELLKVTDDKTFSSVKKRMSQGNAVSINIGTNSVEPHNDIIQIKVPKRYSENQLAQHIIGYLDYSNIGVTGIEKEFENILHTDKKITARMSIDAKGKIISGDGIEIQNSEIPTTNIQLTIDKKIQKITESSLKNFGVKKGCAIVTDIKTGAILSIASCPTYNPCNISESINNTDSPFINRALQSYSIGSIFKVVVAAAAIENGIKNYEYTCGGTCNVGDSTFSCNKKTAHGKMNMQKALENSCNTYFVNLSKLIGKEKLLDTAIQLGFGSQVKLSDTIISSEGTLPSAKLLSNPGELAVFSFGQGVFTANAMQLSQMMSAVANKGKYMQPYLIKSVKTANGKIKNNESVPVYTMSETTAEKLRKMLVSVVENGNAIKAKLSKNVSAAGKTATAQTGVYDKNGIEICNTWFGGFFPADNPQYTIIILKENGISGANDCAPIFKQIADRISALQ